MAICLKIICLLFVSSAVADLPLVVTIIPSAWTGETSEQYQTLTQYISSPQVFNTSSTTIEFLHGEHQIVGISTNKLVIESQSNIVWKGISEVQPILNCKQEFAFIFKDITNLTLEHLTIINCGSIVSTIEDFLQSDRLLVSELLQKEMLVGALLLDNAFSVRVTNLSMHKSKGYGLVVHNMLGASVIDSSLFIQNQENRNKIGGNAVFIYSNKHSYTESPRTYLNITNSHFLNGSDYSNYSYSCEEIDTRANGLSIVMTHSIFEVKVTINNVTFSGNSKNLLHPSIRISDYSNTNNDITVSDSKFEQEGALIIQRSLENFRLNSKYISRIRIMSSYFNQGIDTGIRICMIGESNRRIYQQIIIDNCTFYNFKLQKYQPMASVLQVQQIYVFKSCPQILVGIFRSLFLNNQISSANFSLTTRSYEPLRCTSITLYNCTFKNNESPSDSSIVYITRQDMNAVWQYEQDSKTFREALNQVNFTSIVFINNSLSEFSYKGIITAKQVYASFSNCHFLNSVGTALQGNISVISLYNRNYFRNNIGKEGGALSLIRSRLHLNRNSTTIITNNIAEYGGGLFSTPVFVKLEDPLFWFIYTSQDTCALCTLSLPTYHSLTQLNITFELMGNTAQYSGDSVFYGAFSQCCIAPNCSEYKCSNQNFAFINASLTELLSVTSKSAFDFSSIATKLLTCDEHVTVSVSTYPGAAFNLSVKTTGEFRNTSAVVVTGRLCTDSDSHVCAQNYQSELRSTANKQLATSECRNITYSVHSRQSKVYLLAGIHRLNMESPSMTYYKQNEISITANVSLLQCPTGYELANKLNEKPYCECTSYLASLGLNCNINQDGKILRPKRMWIGFYYTHPDTIVAHKHCPFDYCKSTENYLSLNKTRLYQQCSNSRAGVLCGMCHKNTSLVLGTSSCKECSNIYLLLIIPFALAGVALVVLLLKCNLTVSVGHINGLIFYANIVHINKPLFFPRKTPIYVILTTFIAWFNLDFGIETCFFDKMDAYAKVWLQFVFPVYVWIMIGVIVIMAHYSSRAGRLIGNNSVPVLATLFILSYAKLLRTTIAAVCFTFIEFEDGSYDTVWLYDANVPYLNIKHSMLFLAAVIFTFGYIVPLCLLFLLTPCLQRWSHRKFFRWVNTVKPFLDANQGPYKSRFRYWTGMLLLVRVFLFCVFAANYDDDSAITFFWIAVVVSPIAIISLTKQVYRNRAANCLESMSLLNVSLLCMTNWLAAATSYSKIQVIGEYTSGISATLFIVLFLLTVLYQLLGKFDLPSRIVSTIRQRYLLRNEGSITEIICDQKSIEQAPTCSLVEIDKSDRLLQPLLDTGNS